MYYSALKATNKFIEKISTQILYVFLKKMAGKGSPFKEISHVLSFLGRLYDERHEGGPKLATVHADTEWNVENDVHWI